MIFNLSFVNNHSCYLCFQYSFNLLLNSYLSLVTALLFLLLLLDNLVLFVLFQFLFLLRNFHNLAFVRLLTLFKANLDYLISVFI